MLRKVCGSHRNLLRRTEGSAAVEFAILGTVFILFLAGIIDLGHAWYMKQVVTNASREGSRYGVIYRTNSAGNRIAPNALSPTIASYVSTTYLANTLLPADAYPSVTPGGTGYSSTAKGAPLQVTVSATKKWFMLSMVPGMGTQRTLTATTVMQLE